MTSVRRFCAGAIDLKPRKMLKTAFQSGTKVGKLPFNWCTCFRSTSNTTGSFSDVWNMKRMGWKVKHHHGLNYSLTAKSYNSLTAKVNVTFDSSTGTLPCNIYTFPSSTYLTSKHTEPLIKVFKNFYTVG